MSDQKPFVTIEPKLPKQCKAGELVRGYSRGVVEWAIVAEDNTLVVLPSKKGSLYVIKSEKFGEHCLSYGKQFQLLPEYVKPPIMGVNFGSTKLICTRSQEDAETCWYLLGARPPSFVLGPNVPDTTVYLNIYNCNCPGWGGSVWVRRIDSIGG
jgi:hypothetical protein